MLLLASWVLKRFTVIYLKTVFCRLLKNRYFFDVSIIFFKRGKPFKRPYLELYVVFIRLKTTTLFWTFILSRGPFLQYLETSCHTVCLSRNACFDISYTYFNRWSAISYQYFFDVLFLRRFFLTYAVSSAVLQHCQD